MQAYTLALTIQANNKQVLEGPTGRDVPGSPRVTVTAVDTAKKLLPARSRFLLKWHGNYCRRSKSLPKVTAVQIFTFLVT